MLAMIAIAIVRLHTLFGIVMLFSIYSLISAMLFVVLDAVDVAFTEAAVGAGISSVLMLATLVSTGRNEKPPAYKRWLPLTVVFLTGAGLVWGTLDMPGFGDPLNPIHVHVADRYIEQSPIEIGIPNMVTSVLASYRGYDTMGEVIVVFTALIGVMSLIGIRDAHRPENVPAEVREKLDRRPYPVLQVMALLLIPFIIVFALYVQFHGDYGPGGGFQAGVILASAFVLYTLTYGLDDAIYLIPPKLLLFFAALGVLIYGGTGVASLFLGGNFLDYNVLAGTPTGGQHLGIIVIELGVGMTVASVMIAVFFAFVSRAEARPLGIEDEKEKSRLTAAKAERIESREMTQ